jgi:hypothetical protein
MPYRNETEMYSALTSHTTHVMEGILAGISFDGFNPLSENIKVRKSAGTAELLSTVFCVLKYIKSWYS